MTRRDQSSNPFHALITTIVPRALRPKTQTAEALAGSERDEVHRSLDADDVGVDDQVVVRRQLVLDAVEAAQVVGAFGDPSP